MFIQGELYTTSEFFNVFLGGRTVEMIYVPTFFVVKRIKMTINFGVPFFIQKKKIMKFHDFQNLKNYL